MTRATYTLGGPDRGRGERVLRDGVHVATIFADGHYNPTLTAVSLNPMRWNGPNPSGYPLNPDAALFFDFTMPRCDANAALPKVIERVEACLQWRARQ